MKTSINTTKLRLSTLLIVLSTTVMLGMLQFLFASQPACCFGIIPEDGDHWELWGFADDCPTNCDYETCYWLVLEGEQKCIDGGPNPAWAGKTQCTYIEAARWTETWEAYCSPERDCVCFVKAPLNVIWSGPVSTGETIQRPILSGADCGSPTG